MTVSRLPEPPVVINLGLRSFAEALEDQGVTVLDVDWTPPRHMDPKLAALLERLG